MPAGEGGAKRLTKRTVDAAAAEAARYTVWDTDLKGFGLRVEPSGTKTYVVRYRVGGGRNGTLRQFKIGRAGKLTPDEARDAAKSALAQVEVGKDPQAARAADRQVLTLAELCDLYMREGVATKKASTLKLDKIRIEGHLKPILGRRKITEIGSGDVARLLSAVADGKARITAAAEEAGAEPKVGSRVRGGKAAATKTVKLLGAIYTFAIQRGLCSTNPRGGVETFADVRRERFLTGGELARLGDVLTAAADDPRHIAHVAILRLLLLTGARKNEIARLRRTEIKGDYLQLEDSKTGRKVVRLGAPAQEVLAAVPEVAGSPWVFPDPRDKSKPIANLDFAWVGLRKAAGLDDVRIHDLRHSFASVGVAGGAPLFFVSKLLGHAHAATTQRYAHLSDDPVKAAADRISQAVSSALAGKPSADITPLPAGQPDSLQRSRDA